MLVECVNRRLDVRRYNYAPLIKLKLNPINDCVHMTFVKDIRKGLDLAMSIPKALNLRQLIAVAEAVHHRRITHFLIEMCTSLWKKRPEFERATHK